MTEKTDLSLQTHFIINPGAGAKASDKVIKAILERFPDASGRIYLTRFPGDATGLAKEAVSVGAECIMVAGGDGTINEVVKVLVNQPVKLGIVPAGSGNGFARHLGIKNRFDHLDLIASGSLAYRLVDVMRVNDRYSINVAGFGFDARIAHLSAVRKSRGAFMYIRLILKELLSYKPLYFNGSVDGKRFEKTPFLLSIANSNQYGNGAYIAPFADISDGVITLCGVDKMGFLTFFSIFFRMLTRNISGSGEYFALDGRELIIRHDGCFEGHLDGEPVLFENDVTISVIPLSVRILG
jgi:diacylglycerol kinase (ATP)